jgi:hypothetical protein
VWANQNLPQPHYLDEEQTYMLGIPDENHLAVRYGFPYFAQKPVTADTTPAGYFCGRFDFDTGTFSQLRKHAEL